MLPQLSCSSSIWTPAFPGLVINLGGYSKKFPHHILGRYGNRPLHHLSILRPWQKVAVSHPCSGWIWQRISASLFHNSLKPSSLESSQTQHVQRASRSTFLLGSEQLGALVQLKVGTNVATFRSFPGFVFLLGKFFQTSFWLPQPHHRNG